MENSVPYSALSYLCWVNQSSHPHHIEWLFIHPYESSGTCFSMYTNLSCIVFRVSHIIPSCPVSETSVEVLKVFIFTTLYLPLCIYELTSIILFVLYTINFIVLWTYTGE